jgi:hypothetical protein
MLQKEGSNLSETVYTSHSEGSAAFNIRALDISLGLIQKILSELKMSISSCPDQWGHLEFASNILFSFELNQSLCSIYFTVFTGICERCHGFLVSLVDQVRYTMKNKPDVVRFASYCGYVQAVSLLII